MTLRIHNTLTRALEPFSPLEPGHVRMYVCGMTVYDLCHLGHARSMVAFDVVQRWLKASGFRVTYVRNVTDIDDKIIKRALENGETIRALTDRMVQALHQDADALGIERPTLEPRAMDYVPQMLAMIDTLQHKGLAYQASNGDMNFAVRKFPGYGQLSGKSLDQLQAGERVAVDDGKQDPLDFVLWKSAKPTEPDDAKWPSAYGVGRPGWHIECSAMGCELLGESFDIHGGGADLQFPHHENEIAQSQGASGKPMAQVWMHNGFINIDNEKMSKSLGNFFTIRDVLKRFDGETLRFFLIRTHYRSPLNFSDSHLEDARAALRLGFSGKTCLHPTQVPIANTVFTPTEAAVNWAQKVLAAAAAPENQGKGAFTIDGKMVELSARELGLLEVLLQRTGRLVSKDQLVERLCEWGEEVSNNAIEVYIHRLRKKIEKGPIRIATVRGLGYCLEKIPG